MDDAFAGDSMPPDAAGALLTTFLIPKYNYLACYGHRESVSNPEQELTLFELFLTVVGDSYELPPGAPLLDVYLTVGD